ncbi:hypothetical protein HZB78_03070 [Candidatus Collierbacteria bacterium]|nr:hypothetical protein [Candidatus Collierbacteria bacterium]
MNTITISTKELRLNMPKIRRGLSGGRKYLLIHRSKPIAEIAPPNNGFPSSAEALDFFANPPKEMLFKSDKSAVELVREDREE